MSKLNIKPGLERTVTHEGAPAVVPPLRTELLLTAASTFFGEKTFYEPADERAKRLVDLVHRATKADPVGTAKIIADTRSLYRIRTASIVMAVEYGRAYNAARATTAYDKTVGASTPRAVVDAVIQRPDECAEVIAYWHANYGRSLPWWLRRGVADAASRCYTERNVLKYNARSALVSVADVIELTHPKPKAPWQSGLFRYLLDEAHHGDGGAKLISRTSVDTFSLEMIKGSITLGKSDPENRRHLLREWGPEGLGKRGYTWERLAGWLPGGMDAEAWEAVIPSMGVMALIRNLRNFDQAGISEAAIDAVIAKITDVEEVKRSRIFPYQVWSAYKNAPSDNWARALGHTLDHVVGNLPDLPRTLFLMDFSGSMDQTLSKRSEIKCWEVASIMGLAMAKRSTDVDLGVFATHAANVLPQPGTSLLKQMTDMGAAFRSGHLGWGTMIHHATASLFDPKRHDQVIVFTDSQAHDRADAVQHVPTIVYWDLVGYQAKSDWGKRRLHVGGFSEAAFSIVAEYLSSLS